MNSACVVDLMNHLMFVFQRPTKVIIPVSFSFLVCFIFQIYHISIIYCTNTSHHSITFEGPDSEICTYWVFFFTLFFGFFQISKEPS